MDEELQSFVSLLNRQRKSPPVPKELSGLPNWAQRELAKRPEPAAPRQTAPINGATHDDKPKPEIIIEAKSVEVLPPPKPASTPAPPIATVSAADRVRDPQALLARILAEETRAAPPKPATPPAAKIVTPAAEKKLEVAPPPVAEKKADGLAPTKIALEKISLEKIPGGKIEPPVSAPAAEMTPMQPLIAEALASPRAGRRPLAYALAAAAVIAVVAVVVGAYWYTHNEPALVADAKIAKPATPAANKPAPAKLAGKPATPAPVAPAKLAGKPPAPTPAAPAKLASKPPASAPVPPAKIAVETKPTPAAPKLATTAKPADKPKADTKVAAAPAPATKPAPPPALVQKVVEKPQPVAAAKPTAPAMTVPKTVAIGPSPVSTQIAMLTPPLLTPVAPSVKPAAVAPPVAPAKPPANPMASAPPVKPAVEPTVAMSGEPTWQRNAIPAPPFSGQPQIAIVIDDLGLDRSRTERAIALSGPVTFSFLAYASDLPKQTVAARHAGHELIVHIPMEPILRPKYVSQASGGADPVRAELLRRLRWDLSRFDGYVGVNNHLGNRLSADPEAMQTVIGELKARGLLFLDSRVGGAGAVSAAERRGVPTLTRDILLDDDVTATSVADRLANLEKIAREHGTAIAIGHPHDQTLDALTVWIASLPAKGLQLVPLTAIVRDRDQHIAGAN